MKTPPSGAGGFKIMKKLVLTFSIILIINSLTIAQNQYLGLKLGALNHRWGEVGIGYGITPLNDDSDYIPTLIVSPTVGMEFNYATRGEDRKIYAPKFSLEAHYILLGTRLNIVDYQAGGQHDWRFRPEAGVSLVGILSVFYGYNVPLSETRFPEIQPHKLSVCINLPLIKL
jgi:hypothetical protein